MAKKDWNYRQLAAEFIATALFVWAGCGAAVSSNRWTETAAILDPG
jgi:glycerol uptake facilitator-like aquaporin